MQQMSLRETPLLEMRNISKVFPGVRALHQVSIALQRGEVRALVGENGAGKSTLIKILSGVYQPSEGEIWLDGRQEAMQDPAHALKLGIIPVHQEVNLEPYLSIAENIYIGRQPRNRLGLIDYRRMNQEAKRWLAELGVATDPSVPLGMISIAERQMVAIARAVSLEARVVIFDEPTSSLTLRETERLFTVIRRLKEKNIAVIYISHRLEEIFRICDSLTVMRDGMVVATKPIGEVDTDAVIRLMIGRDLKDMYQRTATPIGKPVLEVKNLTVKGILNDISFAVHSGEIVGIAGLVGAGRTELARAIFGDLPHQAGQITIDGKPLRARSPDDGIKAGLGLVPEDRKDEGLVLAMPVTKNISMSTLGKLSPLGIIRGRKEAQLATDSVRRLAIKTPSIKQQVQYLSGGNQQRVVVAKWLATQPKVLLVDEPTRGIDVGAKSEIYALLNQLAGQGVGILMISSELPEILAMSDRILVMHQGRIKANLRGVDASEEIIMRYATGQAPQARESNGKGNGQAMPTDTRSA
jgi:ribose transport system ATP-binding protein